MGNPPERILGVDGGGTKTSWVLVETDRSSLRVLEEGRLPASNLRLTSPERLKSIFHQLPHQVERVGMFLAGCVTEDDRANLAKVCQEVWTKAKIVTGSDRDSGFAAAFGNGDGIVVNAGTGSSITGRRGNRIEKAGGWGHILGDAGGGYFLSIQALRLILQEYDLHRGEVRFAGSVLQALCLNNLDELVRWAQTADKMDMAMLTPVVFTAAENGDARVQEILDTGARVLAEYTSAVAKRLGFEEPVVKLLGGLFQGRPLYCSIFERELLQLWPRAQVKVAEQPPELGAAWLATKTVTEPKFVRRGHRAIDALATAVTEQSNPRSQEIEKMSSRQLVDLFVDEESLVQKALRERATELAGAIDLVAERLREGGRLFYVGAGTSGRLGILDASEIPPTFGVPLELVQGIIAGGATALCRSIEGAEDERSAGTLAVDERGVSAADVVCGITASGYTPFVLGALERAQHIGARTILLTCNPGRSSTKNLNLEIDLPTGPELLTGSTRLKAGTATKVALNIISTSVMILLGKVRGNAMIDLAVCSDKLRNRAARLVVELLGCDYPEAVSRLKKHAWNLRETLNSIR